MPRKITKRSTENILQDNFYVGKGKYIIHEDETVSVDDDCRLYNNGQKRLPIKFRQVSGNFDVSYTSLTSLAGSPVRAGSFDFRNSNIRNLSGAPRVVDENFSCYGVRTLVSLKGGPETVGGDFDCSSTGITNLQGAPRSVGGSFDCGVTEITSLMGISTVIGGTLYFTYRGNLGLLAIPYFSEPFRIYIGMAPHAVKSIVRKYASNNKIGSRLAMAAELINAGYPQNATF